MHRKFMLALAGLAGLVVVSALLAQDPEKMKPVRLKVIVPPTADLEVEGAKTKQTGSVRRFISPPVEVGKNYIYTLKATWIQDGKPMVVTREVKVKPGEETEVDLTKDPMVVDKDKDKGGDKDKDKGGDKDKDKDKGGKLREPDVIFVPTPQEVVDKMLELAKVTKDDVLYDLGCGNGIIVVTAAKKYGCKATGFDIDPDRIKDSNENVEKNKVGDLVKIEQKDIFTLDLSKANVITLYLLPSLNVKLIPQLEKLKPGSRIVSHDFDMKGMKPDKMETVDVGGREHKVYLWTIPLKKED